LNDWQQLKTVECKDSYSAMMVHLLMGGLLHPSQIACLDMHHLVFGINFQIHFISLISLITIYLIMHLTNRHHTQHPLLPHSFTADSKLASSTNLPTVIDCWHPKTALTDNQSGLDLSCSAHSTFQNACSTSSA